MDTTTVSSRLGILASTGSRMFADISVELAQSRLDRQRALELYRDVYFRKGLLREITCKPQVLPQACAPGSAMFVALERDTIVGVITFYMDSVIGLPMDDVHGEEVDEIRKRFSRVAEAGGLAVLEHRRGLGITMMLYQATVRWAMATKAQCLVACINPSSRRVYTKLLLFEVLGECKPHPRFQGAPSIPIAFDLTTARARFRNTHGCELDDVLSEVNLPYTTEDFGSGQYLAQHNLTNAAVRNPA
jgi:hypothetical protein